MSKIINFIKSKDFTAIAIALVLFVVWFSFASTFEPWTVLVTFILGCYYVGQLTMKIGFWVAEKIWGKND